MKKGFNDFWKLFWITGITLQLTSPIPALGQLGGAGDQITGALSSISNELANNQRQQQQIQLAQTLDMANPDYQAPDDLGLGCAMLPTTPPTQLPSCQQNPTMAPFLGELFSQNARLYEGQSQAQGSIHSPIGLKCLEERTQALDAQFAQHEENFEALMATLKNQLAGLFSEIQNDLNNIKDINALLEGGRSGDTGTIDKNAIDYSALFKTPPASRPSPATRPTASGEIAG